MQKASSDNGNSIMMTNIQRLANRSNHQTNTSTHNNSDSPPAVASSPSSYNPMSNANKPIDVSEFSIYKLYSFDDEHLLHKADHNSQSPTNRPSSCPSSPDDRRQRIETFDEAQGRQIESSVEASLLLDKYRNELCDRKSKFGRKCPYHPAIAEIYTKMGLLHQHMLQQPEKALRYHSKALELLRKCCMTASTTTTIDNILRNSDKNTVSSQEHPRQAQHDRLELVQRCTSDMAVTLADIGHVQRSLGRNADALSSYREAIDTFAMVGASEHHPARNAALAGINLMTCG